VALSWKWPLPSRKSRQEQAPDPIAAPGRARPASEYEDRYPDAYGHGEESGSPAAQPRHFTGLGLPRQVRDAQLPPLEPGGGEAPADAAPVAPANPRPRAQRHVERPRRPLVQRTPREICDEVYERLNDNPYIDASGIMVSVDDAEVTLSGTINSLIAVSLAQALASGVPGVGRVQVQLRVQPAPRGYVMVPDDRG